MSKRLFLVGFLALLVGACETAGYETTEFSGGSGEGRVAATAEPAERCVLRTSTAGTTYFLECR